MLENIKKANLVISGGGIKGIAFIGAYESAEKRGYVFENIAGVSAGALAGSYIGAGYDSQQLLKIMEEFDFGKIEFKNISKNIPAVSRYMEYRKMQENFRQKSLEDFFERYTEDTEHYRDENEIQDTRIKILKSAISMGKEGCLMDGDYLEEWISKTLRARGIITFGDLKYGKSDKINPNGYKVRMTAVDINRWKIVVLPDDISFYGIDPDRFEVAKAIRMSTSVPFAFKPVEIKKQTEKAFKSYHFVDGGVLDDMPSWLVDDSMGQKVIGFRMKSGNKTQPLDTPLKILKALIFFVHKTGVPKHVPKIKYMADIDTSAVSFLDFDLSDKDKVYLYRMGRYYANILFNKMDSRYKKKNYLQVLCTRIFGRY